MYAAATVLGLAPGVVLYCFAGGSMRSAAGSGGILSDPTLWMNLGGTIISIIVISRVASNVVQRATATKEEVVCN